MGYPNINLLSPLKLAVLLAINTFLQLLELTLLMLPAMAIAYGHYRLRDRRSRRPARKPRAPVRLSNDSWAIEQETKRFAEELRQVATVDDFLGIRPD